MEDWLQLAVWGGMAGLLIAVCIIERPGRRQPEQRGFEVKARKGDAVSDDTPADDEPQFPFGSVPFLNDMMKAMSAQGPLNWQIAAEAAAAGARGDTRVVTARFRTSETTARRSAGRRNDRGAGSIPRCRRHCDIPACRPTVGHRPGAFRRSARRRATFIRSS